MRRAVVATAALVSMLAWGATPARAELYLVSAGNNLGKEDEPALRFAEQDATRFASLLSRLAGMPAQNSVLVLGEKADSLRDVLSDLNARIRARAGAGGERTTLVVFYSGHADATGLHLGESNLPFRELRNLVAGSAADVRVLIMDACRSGDVTRVKGGAPDGDFEITAQNSLETEGLAIITSSAAGEDSYESTRLGASFFSHHLINALRGAADKNRDGQITLDEAYQYTYVQTLRSSGRTREIQHPTFLYELKGKGQLVLIRLANDWERSGRLEIDQPGTYLVFEESEDGKLAAEFAVSEKGTRLLLPAGDYFIQRRGRTHYREYRVSLAPGQEQLLNAVDHRTVEYARLLRKGGGERSVVAGLMVSGGIRSGLLDGQAYLGQAQIGATLDLPWLTFGLRARFAWSDFQAASGLLETSHKEVGVGLTAQRYLDLSGFSLGLGLLLEGAYHWQDYATEGSTPIGLR